MTLLKAYLLGTKDPFVLAKVFYEDVLLKDFAAVDDKINEILGWDWKALYNLSVKEVTELTKELSSSESKLAEWNKEIKDLKEQIKNFSAHPEFFEKPSKLTTYANSDYDLLQEIEDLEEFVGKLKKDVFSLRSRLKEGKAELKDLLVERAQVAKELTSVSYSDLFPKDKKSNLSNEVRHEVHMLGLDLLHRKKKTLDDLTTGEMAKVMNVPDPKELVNMIDAYKAKIEIERKPQNRVIEWNNLEEAILNKFGKESDVYKKREHQRKIDIINSKIKMSKKSLKELEKNMGGESDFEEAAEAAKNFKGGPNEKMLPSIGRLTFKRVLEKKKNNKVISTEILSKYKYNPDTKQFEEIETPVKEEKEEAVARPDPNITFDSDKFWESFAIGYSGKKGAGVQRFKGSLITAFKSFFEKLEEEEKEKLKEKPSPIFSDDAGVSIDTRLAGGSDTRKKSTIKNAQKIKLKNLETLKGLLENNDLENDRDVNYILQYVQKEINSLEKKLSPEQVGQQERAAKRNIKFLETSLNIAYESIKMYDSGKYPDKFIGVVYKLIRSNWKFDDLLAISQDKLPSVYEKVSEHEKETLEKPLEKLKTLLNKKNKRGDNRQKLINHIANSLETEEFKSRGQISPEVHKELKAAYSKLAGITSKRIAERNKRYEKTHEGYFPDPDKKGEFLYYKDEDGKFLLDDDGEKIPRPKTSLARGRKKKDRITEEEYEKFVEELKNFLEKIEEHVDSNGEVDEDLTSAEIKDMSTEYKKLNDIYQQLLKKRGTPKGLGEAWSNVRTVMSKIFMSSAGKGEIPHVMSQSILPDEKIEHLKKLTIRLQMEVEHWLNDRDGIFKGNDKEEKWSKSEVRTYIDQALPEANRNLLNPRIKSDFKEKIFGRVRKDRNTLINKILFGLSAAAESGMKIKDRDLNWVLQQMGPKKDWSAKEKKLVPTMMGEHDESKPKFRQEVSFADVFGDEDDEHSEYEEMGASRKEIAEEAAKDKAKLEEWKTATK